MSILPTLREQLVAAVGSTAPKMPPRRRWRAPRAAAVALTAILAITAAGAAAMIIDQAQEQSAQLTTAPTQQGDAGPALRYGVDVAAAARRIQQTVPYPAGRHDDFDWAKYRPDPGAQSEYEGSLRAFIEFRASCMWRHEWVDAAKANNTGQASRAAAILADVPAWPGIRGDRGTGPERARTVADWARDGDVARVEETLRTECHGI